MATVDSVVRRKVRELERNIEISATESLAPMMNQEMRQSVIDTVYSVPESPYYNRTMGLLNSTTTSIAKERDSLIVSVFNDPSLMSDPHSSWVDAGSDMRQHIPLWMARGHHGIVSYTPSNYDILTYNRLINEKKYIKILKKELRAKGYIVK